VSLRFAPGGRATLYHRHGDWLVALQAVLLAALAAGQLVRWARATR
jgi:hypothetical protein